MTRKLKKGSYMALFTIVVIAAIIIANLIIGKIPAKYRKWDLSTNQILTLGDTTKDILSKLDKDVTAGPGAGGLRRDRQEDSCLI